MINQYEYATNIVKNITIADRTSVVAKLFNMQTKKLKIWDSTFVHLHQETLTSKTIIKETSKMDQMGKFISINACNLL